ncbi:methylated-DNA--[protein]-cysteine S-methyltransferase [uncultured Campylobacter sp.]|uniref:methylated-DNA--[protein]-cysteine S-methyltransferase n=1 Tax=uncultured Campylobacter sp. TaxID=218934 RepID=UPI002623C3DA|nr:methylated-DNA--[protein]-cysteine S-methyltransferase [uncultured Campylobacter sp.]
MKFIAYYDSPLGEITLAGDEAGLCGLWFEGEKYYAHALAASGADEKQDSADLFAKEKHAASETQRDFAALKKSTKSDFAAKATNGADEKYNARDFAEAESGADVKFCANVLVASEKFCERDFAAQDASKKSYATDLSAQSVGEKFCINKQSGYFEEKNLPVLDQTKRWLDLYFSGREPGFTPALNPVGSAFRRAVWEILLKIPYGKTTTYGQIAREIAAARGLAKMSAQAVGGAVGHNDISIIIPCHRVIGAHGNLTGYAGGIDRKIKLLKLEGINM